MVNRIIHRAVKSLIAIVMLMSLVQCSLEEIDRKEMPLERYNYTRRQFRSDDLPYLLGNAEMGGMTDNLGRGLEKTWFTDGWSNKEWRQPLPGFLIVNEELKSRDYHQAEFLHELNIKNGIQHTLVQFPDGKGYETRLFFSKTEKHRLVLFLKNTSVGSEKDIWFLTLPVNKFRIRKLNGNIIAGASADTGSFTKYVWVLKSSKPILEIDGRWAVQIAAGEENLFLYSVTTQWDGADYQDQACAAITSEKSYKELEKQQIASWDEQWRSIASVVLPEGEYAKWFYRSIALLYWTSGAEHFCAAEKQFAVPDPDWHMHPFTYGHGGGWSVWAFARLGDRQRALNIARWHYQPKALKENVKILFPKTGPVELIYRGKRKGVFTYLEEYNPNAIAFGHEVDTDGHNITYEGTKHWDLQRHIDGFAGAFYDLLHRYYPDSAYTVQYSYPVLKGTAEFYSSLVKWDTERQFYYFPPLLSVSENIMEKSVQDLVLAAKWTLKNAVQYSKRLGKDGELRQKWANVYERLYVPQNDTTYLEYLDDNQNRPGGGYFGIRAFSYLGFPLLNRIKDIDRKKARNALDRCWERNNRGEGMITFILNWFALTEAYLGNGEKAYEISNIVPTIQDSSGTCLVEAIARDRITGRERRINKYFLTGNSSFILVPLAMILQSYNHVIRPFPAMPPEMQSVEFYDLPAEEGIRVSGIYRNGKTQWVSFKKDEVELLQLKSNKPVKIMKQENELRLIVQE